MLFDASKDAANREKHGISLAAFDAMVDRQVAEDVKHSTAAEVRFHVIGRIAGRVYVAVITYRAGVERVISLRPASRKERTRYEAIR